MRVAKVENRWSQDQLIAGAELGQWLKVLKAAQWNVSPVYLHRAAWVTAMSLATSALGRIEEATYGKRIAQMTVDPTPLFVVGHWRSGTTHMHDLLGRDPNHTYTTVWQVVFPTTFLTTGRIGPAILKRALPSRRTYDNMSMGWDVPAEDEIALLKLHGMSFYGALMFPDAHAQYEKYIDFLEATEDERRQWKDSFQWFIKKVMIATGGKRVVVKSCPHSARIRMILDLYPDARFIHIHRHPYRVFASMLHMRSKVDWENFFQRPEQSFIDFRREHTAIIGERLYTRLIQDRKLIPPENLIEIGYEDFCGNEAEHLARIYRQFNLPDHDRYEAIIRPYLRSLEGYKTNKLSIDQDLKDFIWDRWRPVFETYGYSREYNH